MTTIPFNRDIKAALDGKADKPISAGDLSLPQGQLFVGQPSGLAQAKAISGLATADSTGQLLYLPQQPSLNPLTNPFLESAFGSATLAEINVGKTIINAEASSSLRLASFFMQVTGTWLTGDSISIFSKVSSALVASFETAGLTDGAVLTLGSANVTLYDAFFDGTPQNEGWDIIRVGTNFTGGTSIKYSFSYVTEEV